MIMPFVDMYRKYGNDYYLATSSHKQKELTDLCLQFFVLACNFHS
jgi:hypothetical protein